MIGKKKFCFWNLFRFFLFSSSFFSTHFDLFFINWFIQSIEYNDIIIHFTLIHFPIQHISFLTKRTINIKHPSIKLPGTIWTIFYSLIWLCTIDLNIFKRKLRLNIWYHRLLRIWLWKWELPVLEVWWFWL